MLNSYQFTPDLQDSFRRSLNGQGATLPANASQALQVLSLHLPQVLGGAPPAPDAPLRPQVGGMRPDLAVRSQVTGNPTPPAYTAPVAGPSLTSPTDSAPLSVGQPSGSWSGSVAPVAPPMMRSQVSQGSPFPSQGPDQGPERSGGPGAPFISMDQGNPTSNTGDGTGGIGTGGGIPDINSLLQSLFGGGNFSGQAGPASGQDFQSF
jgi:hypothetical protein